MTMQCATGYPVPVPVPANPANIFQSGSGSGSGQILAGLAGFLKIIQKYSKMLKMYQFLFFGVDKQSFSSNHSFEADNAHNKPVLSL